MREGTEPLPYTEVDCGLRDVESAVPYMDCAMESYEIGAYDFSLPPPFRHPPRQREAS